jgi:aminodeoxyfutalosine deaminase
MACVEYCATYRERGIVGVGLGGEENLYPPAPFAPVFERVRAAGLGSVPHAGEAAGPSSIRDALRLLRADRIRHGIRAVEDPALVLELLEAGVVLDVCPISNLRTGTVRSLAEHPLPDLMAVGIPCSISTDDPEMFDTDLVRTYAAATSLGLSPRSFYEAGLRGALCDPVTKADLSRVGAGFAWGTE